MITLTESVAERVARTASDFQQRQTGSDQPASVTIVATEGTLVVTLHGALPSAETELASTPAGALHITEFYRRLFAHSPDWLREEIERITGMEVRDAVTVVEPLTGAVVHTFTTSKIAHVFQFVGDTPQEPLVVTDTTSDSD
jgi:uncharacterized protein YbcI